MTFTDRIADLSLLWRRASEIFPYFDRVGVDWDGTYYEFIPRAAEAEDAREFHLLLAEFLNTLGDGHTDYSFPRALADEAGYLPFALRHIGGAYYIEDAGQGRGVRLAKVLAVNGEPFAALLERAFRYIYHVGGFAYPSRLAQILPFMLRREGNMLTTPDGERRFDLADKKPVFLKSAPALCSREYRALGLGRLDARLYDGGALYIRLDDLLRADTAESISAALEETSPEAVVLDLRGNIGGMTVFGARIAELFIGGEFSACRKRTRSMLGVDLASGSQGAGERRETIERWIAEGLCDREEAGRCRRTLENVNFREYTDHFGAAGREPRFSGPLAVLTSRGTISAAEDLTAMFRSNRRAVIIGTPTCGTTGTPFLQRLRTGGMARICSVAYRLLDGTEFIGRGIEPDIYAENSPGDVESGFDAVLELALERVLK